MMGTDKRLLGRWGEALAAEYMRRKGWTIVGAGWHCRYGEIDLIAENRKYISFTEVKLRRSEKFAQAREFVDSRKQDRVRTSAMMYLAENPTDKQPRFDVVEIYAPEGMQTLKPEIHFIENAFE